MPIPTRMLLFIVVVSQAAIAAPVFRCMDAKGVPTYTDKICPGRGEEMEASALQPNVYTPEPLPEIAIEDPVEEEPEVRVAGCDNADDLRHIDLMLKSLATDKQQRRFLKAERKRVVNCQLESLSSVEREQRDAALRRTGSLRDSTREAAELEIEGLYGANRPVKRPRKRR